MSVLIAIPVLGFLTIFQSAVVSRLPLLQGTPDLILLVLIAWALQERVRTAWQWSILGGFMMGYVSIIPIGVPLSIYISITFLVLLIRRHIWETPFIAMFALTFIGSIFSQFSVIIYLFFIGNALPILDTLKLIILPSLLLNLLLSAPIYAIIKDLSEWVYPEEILA